MPYKDPEKNKEYQKQYQKKWYQRNKKAHIAVVYKNKLVHVQKMIQFIKDYKGIKGCYSCPENNPVCLDFHHTGNNKDINVATAVQRGWCQKRIQKEIDKCLVICANCHRKLHATEGSEAYYGKALVS